MTLPDFSITRLNSLSAEGSGLTRAAVVAQDAQGSDFAESYDWTTLWYDALQRDGDLLLICPKLLNFRAFLADGVVSVDGAPARIARVRRHRRHDIVRIRATAARTVATRKGRWQGESCVSPDQSALFAGLNSSLHISRNNRLEWIADWARYHVGEHGLQAMLLMDNGSEDYPPEAVLDALQSTGLERAVVLTVPQPYGPPRSKSHSGTGKFLQPAMLNLARLRFLSRARAVLNVDIDELVWSGGGSVFDAAVKSPLGLVSFAGDWRYPGTALTPPHRHADHLHTRPEARPCPTKYCIRPAGPLGWASWDVHRLELPIPSALTLRRDLGYWHCRGITTNWKSYDRLRGVKTLGPVDTATRDIFSRALP